MNEKTRVNIEDAIGKTIENVVDDGCDMMCITFTDGTFSILRARGDEEYATIENANFRESDWNPFELAEMGFGTIEEINARREQERLGREVMLKLERRKQYQNLKAEFGGEE